jgi:tetratricopeptide (TPR) repeat protein
MASDRARPDPDAADGPGQRSHRATDAGGDEHETAYDLFQRGQQLLKDRHHAQAAIVLERAARLEPGKGSILEALGRAYFNSGQPERARAVFADLLEVDPSAHYAHFALGQSLKRLGRRPEAWTHLRLAVALSPRTGLYRDALARLPRPAEVGDATGDAEAADTAPSTRRHAADAENAPPVQDESEGEGPASE